MPPKTKRLFLLFCGAKLAILHHQKALIAFVSTIIAKFDAFCSKTTYFAQLKQQIILKKAGKQAIISIYAKPRAYTNKKN